MKQTWPQRILTGRVVLYLGIAVTSVIPMLFVQLDEPSTRLTIYLVLAKAGSLVGGMFLLWQFFLGFRGAVSSILPDLTWVVDLHKKLGQYGTLLIPLHPVFIGLYYLDSFNTNIYDIDLDSLFSLGVLLGMVLLGIIAFVVISSAFFRRKMGFYQWFYTHLSSYLIPPFLIIHGFILGGTIGGTPLGYIWWGLAALMALFYAYRIAHKTGAFAARLRVIQSDAVAVNTTEVVMASDNRIRPALGQFVYVRQKTFENAHPYTVSSYSEEEGTLGITAKNAGPQTAGLQKLQPGKRMIVDGSYGVFTRIALSTGVSIVMLAGGIGITPFRRVWQLLEERRDREAWLFYGNESYEDIVYRDEIDALEHVKVVPVLNNEPDFSGEKGFITLDILNRHLPRKLATYQFLLCGPPVMVLTIEEALHEAQVPEDQVKHELFSN